MSIIQWIANIILILIATIMLCSFSLTNIDLRIWLFCYSMIIIMTFVSQIIEAIKHKDNANNR